jgi:thymidylate synthase
MKTLEAENLTLQFRNVERTVLTMPQRKLNYCFMVGEWVWIWTGRDDLRMIGAYCDEIKQFSDDGRTFFGAYGPPIYNQKASALKALTDDPASRQAVLSIWRPSPPKSKDIPCTCLMQFLVRDGAVNMTVYMRSSDAWLGIPYDVFNFSMILHGVTSQLNFRAVESYVPGTLTMHLGSSHLYERDLKKAEALVAEEPWLDNIELMKTPRLKTYSEDTLRKLELDTRMLGQSKSEKRPSDKGMLYHDLLCVLHYRFHKDPSLIINKRWRRVIEQTQHA